MKLLFSQLSPPIALEEGCIVSLVMENQVMFRRVTEDIARLIAGDDGACVLSQAGKPISMAKYAELFLQIVPFCCNRKTLLTKVLGAIEQTALCGEHFEETRALLAAIERYLMEIGEEYPIVLDAEKLSIGGLLKLANASIEEDREDIPGCILDYMDMCAELEREKLFIFVNLRSYFTDEELKLFFADTRRRKHRVLMLEGHEHPLLPEERRVIIDADLCEIVL